MRHATDVEPLDIYVDAEKRLNHTDDQQRDVLTALPEAPAEERDDCAGYHEEPEEASHVIPVGDVCAANRSRRKEMPEKANYDENYTEPSPLLVCHDCSSVNYAAPAFVWEDKSDDRTDASAPLRADSGRAPVSPVVRTAPPPWIVHESVGDGAPDRTASRALDHARSTIHTAADVETPYRSARNRERVGTAGDSETESVSVHRFNGAA
jgi:hypothetical protein